MVRPRASGSTTTNRRNCPCPFSPNTRSALFVARFRYTALPRAIVPGSVMFGDLTDTVMTAGASIVVGSGPCTLRGRLVGKRTPAVESTGPDKGPDGP